MDNPNSTSTPSTQSTADAPHTGASCRQFVAALASAAPTPGGGGAAALVGAVGMALGNMVGSLTLGKPKYADVQEDIAHLKEQATALQEELLRLVEEDARAFAPLSRAYGLPRDTPAQQAEKARVMEAALQEACRVPLDIMRCCCEAIALHGQFAAKGTAIAISDVGVGVACCKAALQGASLNVFINTKAMQNAANAAAANQKAQDYLAIWLPRADEIFLDVQARLV